MKYVHSILMMSLARCGSVSGRTGMYFRRLMVSLGLRGRRGKVGQQALCGTQDSQAHGFESWPRSEIRKGIHSR
ncbi:hypothetical protein E2C01_044055 [Portunus trituberculatus]|uniref:Uncharacterized protein n=1 Tax=Portunus trituberculatus TaxID=210409 RepID=A0A5B7FS41_PORTR|nr:hypothetical protein [Portunus trituberculatus]